MEMRKRDAPRRTSSFDDFIQQLGNDIYGWTQVGDDIDGEAAGDRFGFSVAMSADGKRVAIGADSNAGDGQNSGHVRVYDLNEDEGKWTQVGQDLDGEANGGIFLAGVLPCRQTGHESRLGPLLMMEMMVPDRDMSASMA
jgi:hypothetical protein